MYRIAATLLALLAALPAWAEEKSDAERVVRALTPYLDEQTVLIAHLDVEKLDPAALVAAIARVSGSKEREVKEIEVDVGAVPPLLAGLFDLHHRRPQLGVLLQQVRSLARQARIRDVFLVASIADLPGPPFVLLTAPDANRETDRLINAINDHGKDVIATRLGTHLFIGSPKTKKRLADLRPAPHPEIIRAFAAAGPSLAQVLFTPTKDSRRVIEELQPTLPEPLGGGSTQVFTRGLSWAVLSLQSDPQLQLRLSLQSSDAASALELSKGVRRLMDAIGKLKEAQEAAPGIDRVLSLLPPRVEGDQVTIQLKETQADVLAPLVRAAHEHARLDRTARKLSGVVAALINHADSHQGRLPASASYSKDGKPLLSWRVHVLPFLEQQHLYQQFHLDEPWDSEHNKKLITRMPVVYRFSGNADLAAVGKTTLLLPRGKQTIFAGKEGPRFPASIPDGTANTIMLIAAEDAHAVPWTKPEDLEINLQDPLKGLAIGKDGKFWVGFADGSARALPKALDRETLRHLFDPADGYPITLP